MKAFDHSNPVKRIEAVLRFILRVHILLRIYAHVNSGIAAVDIPKAPLVVIQIASNILGTSALALTGAGRLNGKDDVLDDGLESLIDTTSFLCWVVDVDFVESSAGDWLKVEHVALVREYLVNSCSQDSICICGSV